MNRYFGGMGMPGSGTDPFAEALRRKQTAAEKADQRRTDRTAVTTVFAVFAGATVAVIAGLLLFSALSALVNAMF
jgi:hypothetical protein